MSRKRSEFAVLLEIEVKVDLEVAKMRLFVVVVCFSRNRGILEIY